MKNVLIVNYGMGNIKSVGNALAELGRDYTVSSRPEDIARADAYILPGVGGFHQAMENLKNLGLIGPLEDQVLGRLKPVLGICLGMQLFAESSTEKRETNGLGWIRGAVIQIEKMKDLRLPHVGWNDISIRSDHWLFKNIKDASHFYFDHSYQLQCREDYVVARCDYGSRIVAAIEAGNIIGTQFHPEKSQVNGLRIFNNYLRYIDSH